MIRGARRRRRIITSALRAQAAPFLQVIPQGMIPQGKIPQGRIPQGRGIEQADDIQMTSTMQVRGGWVSKGRANYE